MSITLTEGVYIQVYRDAIPHGTPQAKMDWCAKRLDEAVAAGVRGIAWHGFPGELTPKVYSPLAHLCRDRDLLSFAAYGLNVHHPEAVGTAVGKVAILPECDGVLLDAEGAFDNGAKEVAHAMCLALRDIAPHALVVDQPWFCPTVHPSFPYEEFSMCVDVHAPQVYVNDFKGQYGKDRYGKVWHRYQDAWKWLEEKHLGPLRPRAPTIQSYGWDDITSDLDDCLLKNPSLFCWAEPWPTKMFMEALVRLKAKLLDPACRA